MSFRSNPKSIEDFHKFIEDNFIITSSKKECWIRKMEPTFAFECIMDDVEKIEADIHSGKKPRASLEIKRKNHKDIDITYTPFSSEMDVQINQTVKLVDTQAKKDAMERLVDAKHNYCSILGLVFDDETASIDVRCDDDVLDDFNQIV